MSKKTTKKTTKRNAKKGLKKAKKTTLTAMEQYQAKMLKQREKQQKELASVDALPRPEKYVSKLSIDESESILWDGIEIAYIYDGTPEDVGFDKHNLQANGFKPQQIVEILTFEEEIRKEIGSYFISPVEDPDY